MSLIEHFHFLRPLWLLGCLAGFILFAQSFYGSSASSDWKKLISPKLFSSLVMTTGSNKSVSPLVISATLVLLASIALAGPSWNRVVPEEFDEQLSVVVIIDNRLSMYAEDVTPTRLDRAKLKVAQLMDAKPNAHFSVIATAQSAHIVTPLTSDRAFSDLYLNALAPELMPQVERVARVGHSDVDSDRVMSHALEMATDLLEGSNLNHPQSVVVISSGLNQAEVAQLKSYHDTSGHPSLQVMAVGTAEGASLNLPAQLKVQASIETRLPVDNFKQLQNYGVPVTLISHDESDVLRILTHIEAEISQVMTENEDFIWDDKGYWLAWLLIPLVVLWFRRGAAVLSLFMPAILVSTLALHSETASANMDWFFTPDQQAQLALNQGDYQSAAALHTDPYRQAVAYYQAEQYEPALALFLTLNTFEARFYQVNSYAQLKYWDEAYELVSRLNEEYPDSQEVADNYTSIAEVMSELIGLREERLRDQEMTQQEFGEDVEMVESELADQGLEAAFESTDAAINPEAWLEGIDVTPAQLLRNQFNVQYRNQGES
ncbi:VWA domain-containing protein [Vibrio gigantis]|uniref:VWA domain-containing protein n=1 Tax=Vibrio gigantis TaxID=296199 RepID=UPI002FC75D7E